jgi:hypothetical protein
MYWGSAMKICSRKSLSPMDEALLLEVLYDQDYALELISCEITDIETGMKNVSPERYRHLVELFEQLNEQQ